MDLNKVQLIGRLVRDPEVKQTQSGKDMATFSVATSKSWKTEGGEKQEKTEFHNIVVFGNLANVVSMYCKKGKQVYVEGELQTDSYEKDGVKKYATKIMMKNLILLGGKDDVAQGTTVEDISNVYGKEQVPQEDQDLNIPF